MILIINEKDFFLIFQNSNCFELLFGFKILIWQYLRDRLKKEFVVIKFNIYFLNIVAYN